VPCERAFSAINFLYNKLRNRMTVETMDMLVFIYINTRALRQASGAKDWDKDLWKELIEDILLNLEDDEVTQEGDNNIE
jgi:hypothetical protein